MTVSATAISPITDEELLIAEATRQRNRNRSGKSLGGVAALAVFFGAAGYLMAFHPGTITYGTPNSSSFPVGTLLSLLGFAELLAAALLLVTVVRQMRPRAWGDPAPGECPLCGRAALRQDEVVVREGNTLNTKARGTVTTCGTRDCPHASAEVTAPGLPS
jgi:hypothetical protein